MMPHIEYLFPIPVYCCDDFLTYKENKILQDEILKLSSSVSVGGDWNCNTFNSMGTYDLMYDETFSDINNKITEHVNIFAKTFESDWKYRIKNAWFNIAQKNQYQEYHNHSDCVFSAVYYVSLPSGSGEIVFKSKEDDMVSLRNIVEFNKFNSTYMSLQPKERTLLIFRSSLQHMVKMGTNKKPRISVALNFMGDD